MTTHQSSPNQTTNICVRNSGSISSSSNKNRSSIPCRIQRQQKERGVVQVEGEIVDGSMGDWSGQVPAQLNP